MGLFDILSLPEAPKCEKCKSADRGDVTMESGEQWDPRLGQAVSAWICPNEDCSHAVMRDDGDGVQQHDSPVGSMDRDESGGRSDLSTGVMPLDGDGFDDDDGWQSVR